MSQPLEHDYIGLSDTGSSVSAEEDDNNKNKVKVKAHLNLKETELRLGLPGSESPERRASNGNGISLSLSVKGVEEKSGGTNGYVLKNFMTGAKRGFSDVLVDGSGSGKWGFSGNGGSDAADLGKNGGLFSPRNGLENGGQQNGCTGNAMKDGVPASPKSVHEKKPSSNDQSPPAKAQVVGWPPIRSFRKNTMASNPAKNNNEEGKSGGAGCLFVKVSMDGAPYLRKVDLKTYSNYMELSAALKKMFSVFTIGQCSSHGGVPGSDTRVMDLLHGSECVLTFEDKDGDWMLVGDVPWDMFIDSCKRLRIMKGSEAIGLAPRAMEKSKTRN